MVRRWLWRAFYLLPLVIVGATLVGYTGMELAGAECRSLDDGFRLCNQRGEAQDDIFWIGMIALWYSAFVWIPIMLGVLVGAVVGWFRDRSRADHA